MKKIVLISILALMLAIVWEREGFAQTKAEKLQARGFAHLNCIRNSASLHSGYNLNRHRANEGKES